MEHHDALMQGMFWGGLLVASVPILLTLAIGVFVLGRWREARREAREGTGAAVPEIPTRS
ncbi:MAG: hypothetical protein WEA09_14040 [Gemmatimonadota bacterium]